MDEQKNLSLAVLGVVAVIAVVGLVLLFTNAQKTGQAVMPGDKVYGGGASEEQYPYLVDRKVGHRYDGEWGTEDTAWQTGVPYRTYARSPAAIPTDYTSCGADEQLIGGERAREFTLRYGVACRRMEPIPGQLVGFCCPFPNYATGQAREVTKQSFYS